MRKAADAKGTRVDLLGGATDRSPTRGAVKTDLSDFEEVDGKMVVKATKEAIPPDCILDDHLYIAARFPSSSP